MSSTSTDFDFRKPVAYDSDQQFHRFARRKLALLAEALSLPPGGGIAVLPPFMADAPERKLTWVLPRSASITRTFWISARRDVQQTARVRRVRNWVRETVARKKALILPD